MLVQKLPFVFALLAIWLGFVGAISFMEAWLKFRAPGIDVPLGLGIGRLVFNALNKVEWFCFIVVVIQLCFNYETVVKSQLIVFSLLFIILLLQTFWLLPLLDSRAELIVSGQSIPSSNLHFVYVFFEVFKVGLLIFSIIKMTFKLQGS